MSVRSVRAQIEQLVDDGLVSLALANIAFANAKDGGADAAEIENFSAASDGLSATLRGIRQAIQEE